MTEDIKGLVKRLREEADHQHDLAHDCDCAPEATANWAAMLDIRSAADAIEALAGEVEQWKQSAAWDKAAASDFLGRAEEAEAERDRLAGEVDTLQMKLAACTVGALSNTERTVKENRIGPDHPYWSASLGDVYQIVDKEMEARAERDRLKETITTAVNFNEGLAAERDRLKAALGAIAVKAGKSECGGNYVAAVGLIGDLEQMADAALRAAGDGR